MNITSVSWIALAAALGAWVGLVLFAWGLAGAVATSVAVKANAQSANDQQQSAAQTHALALASESGRTALEGLLRTDVISIATMIQTAGKDAGVKLQVSDALQENAPPSGSSALPLGAIGFTVKGEGTFTKLLDAAALLEVLPVPGVVEQLDIGRAPLGSSASGTSPWQLNAHVSVLTASQIAP